MAKKGNGGGLSLMPEDQVEGGGTEGALATITEIDFVQEFTYGGRFKDSPVAALHVVFDIDGFDKPWDQHYSVGPSDKYEVIEDGDGIKSLGKGKGLNKKCPASAFFRSVSKAAEESEIDITDLIEALDEGGHSIAGLREKRVRLTNEKLETVGGDLKEYILIGGFEDEEAPAKGKKATNGSGKASSKNSSSDDIEEKTVEAIKDLIEEHTSVKKSDVANLVYQANKKDSDAKAMMQLAFKESWLADEDRPWSFDKKKGILRASE